MTKKKSTTTREDSLPEDDALNPLVTKGKKSGFVTYDEINKAIPGDSKISIDDLESAIAKFSEAGIDIIEEDDNNDDLKLDIHIDEEIRFTGTSPDAEFEEEQEAEEISPTDDPVRLYLRDMGGVELLSREGEIEIAKRIEEGKHIMLSSLCISPVTLKTFIKWYNDLTNERIMLRELIDIEANVDVDDEETISDEDDIDEIDKDDSSDEEDT